MFVNIFFPSFDGEAQVLPKDMELDASTVRAALKGIDNIFMCSALCFYDFHKELLKDAVNVVPASGL